MTDRANIPDPEFETYSSISDWKAGMIARYQNGWTAGPNVAIGGGIGTGLAIVQSYIGPAPTP